MFPLQATRSWKYNTAAVLLLKVNRINVKGGCMSGHEAVTNRSSCKKTAQRTLLTTPAHSTQNIEPPFLPANWHRRVGRTSTHNNPDLVCLSNWRFSGTKWRVRIVWKPVRQRELKHVSARESYPVLFGIVCARFWTWRTPLWDGGGFVLR